MTRLLIVFVYLWKFKTIKYKYEQHIGPCELKDLEQEEFWNILFHKKKKSQSK